MQERKIDLLLCFGNSKKLQKSASQPLTRNQFNKVFKLINLTQMSTTVFMSIL